MPSIVEAYGDAPPGYYYAVEIKHVTPISIDYRIITENKHTADQYLLIINQAYKQEHEPFMKNCTGCQDDLCRSIVTLVHSTEICFNEDASYYLDLFYENAVCNDELTCSDHIKQAIIRAGGHRLFIDSSCVEY
jgi:hypothetical protein